MTHDEAKARGGYARAEVLGPDERRAIARKAAEARWSQDLPEALFEGSFRFGDHEIVCAVLSDQTRIITQATFLRALGRSRSPKAGSGVLATANELPFFLQAEALRPFLTDELLASTSRSFIERDQVDEGSAITR